MGDKQTETLFDFLAREREADGMPVFKMGAHHEVWTCSKNLTPIDYPLSILKCGVCGQSISGQESSPSSNPSSSMSGT